MLRGCEYQGVTSSIPPIPLPLGLAWSRRARLLDAGSIAVTALASLTYLIALFLNGGDLGGYLGILVTVTGVALTRRYLWVGALVVVLGSYTTMFLGTDPVYGWTIAVFTAFSVALRGRRGALLGVIVGVGVYFAVVLAENQGFGNPNAFVALATSFTAAATGSALRSYGRYQHELEQRTLEAIAGREAETHQRVAEERLRIARDLHDVVGHEVAMLGIQLGVAEVNLPTGAAGSRAALDAARDSVQAVLLETQRILRVLRTDADAPEGSLPAPDYAGIADLVDRYRDAGVTVDAELAAEPTAIDPTVSTAAYRIVQEALTNSQRHGTGAARVSTDIDGGTLTLRVSNARAARPPADAPRGFGLVGMRERATSAGGRLEIGGDDREFRLTAVLPVDGATL